MTSINLESIGKMTQKRIRDEVGVGNITQLKKLAKDSGVDLGIKKETQEKRAYKYFATIINERINADREKKRQEEEKRKEVKRQQAIARRQAQVVPEYIMNMNLTFQCKKIVTDKVSKQARVEIFTVNEDIRVTTTKPENYFTNQIQKANTELKPIYDSYTVQNRVKAIDIIRLRGIFKELKELIEAILRESGIDVAWIMNYQLTQLPIGTPETILLNPIQQAGSINLDGLILNEVWCKNKGTCVPDWLSYKYSKTKGHIKSVKSYEVIEKLSTCCVDGADQETLIYDNKPNVNGYTIKNIELFCQNTNKTLIVLHNGKIIIYNQVLKCEDPLVIEVKNNHLYPITNNRKIKSLTHIGKSNSFYQEEVGKNIYEEIEYIKQEGDPFDYILDTMIQLNVQTYDQKITITNGHLHNFHLDKKLYSTSPYNKDVETYCVINNIPYQGQPALSFLPPFIEKLPSSFMNIDIQHALLRDGVKHRTHYGAFNESNGNILSCDINKCYRFIMENPMDSFMTVDFNSTIVKSGFKNEFGLYYVKTTDMSILHGSNWYTNNILKMAYDNKVSFKTLYFIQGIRQDKTILKKIIDEMKDIFSPEITKTLINSISGYLGKTESHSYALEVDSDINRVWETIPKNVNDFFFRKREYGATDAERMKGVEHTKSMYLFGKKTTKQMLQNNLPMYIQILDWANMLMSKYILELGGFDHLLYRKTDAFIMKDIGIAPNFTDEIGGYKYNIPPVFITTTNERNVSYKYSPLKWTIKDDIKNSDDFEKINTHLQEKSLMISARAGTGKSFIINKVNETNKCVKLAFTNKASLNIGGETIHKFLGIDDNHKCSLMFVLNKLKNVDIIILDEISMIDKFLWKILYEIKYMTGIRFLLCGDYRQLPPVEDNTDYFNHSSIMFMCDEYRCELQYFEKCRYNKALYDFLEDVWEGNPTAITVGNVKKGSHICFTNKKRKEINALYNTKGELIKYTGTDNKYNEHIRILEGVPLVCLVANKKLEMVKNELVTITKVDGDNIYFGEKFISKNDIHKYFMLGYAMTIHKSQGQTIDGILNIHEVREILQDKRMFYTAVSRATCLENVNYVK
jgi:hypothetical protein